MQNSLRDRIVNVLIRVPATDSVNDRSSLLAGIPLGTCLTRNPHSPRVDFELILQQLDRDNSAESRKYLKTFLDNALSRVRGMEAGVEIERLEREALRVVTPAYWAAEPYKFDLGTLVEQSLGRLPTQSTLTGFVVACDHYLFLKNLSDRLKHDWWLSNGDIETKGPYTLSPLHTNYKYLAEKLASFRRLLEATHLIVSVRALDENQLLNLWQEVKIAYPDPLRKHLIVVVGLAPQCSAPGELISLGNPTFSSFDVQSWIQTVVYSQSWPEGFVAVWMSKMISECSFQGALVIEWVYEHLHVSLDCIQRGLTYDEFRQILEER